MLPHTKPTRTNFGFAVLERRPPGARQHQDWFLWVSYEVWNSDIWVTKNCELPTKNWIEICVAPSQLATHHFLLLLSVEKPAVVAVHNPLNVYIFVCRQVPRWMLSYPRRFNTSMDTTFYVINTLCLLVFNNLLMLK